MTMEKNENSGSRRDTDKGGTSWAFSRCLLKPNDGRTEVVTQLSHIRPAYSVQNEGFGEVPLLRGLPWLLDPHGGDSVSHLDSEVWLLEPLPRRPLLVPNLAPPGTL